jgi:hypothetical protein
MKAFPVLRADQLSDVPAQIPWLIEELWTDQAVGILGGEPKCCKSFLALDIALSVASGAPCLRRYPVRRAGPVVYFPAEDSLAIVRQRLDGLAAAANLALTDLPLHVITAVTLRLDLPPDRLRLEETLRSIKPVLLVLDPFIRLHQRDENDASHMAPLLGFLRQLQRQFHLAVVLVHHAKKDGGSLRPGQALRGSSELHGWGDSNLYLRRQRDQLSLTIEHRAAASAGPIPIALRKKDAALSLALLDSSPVAPTPVSPEQRLLQALANAAQPLSAHRLRQQCGLRMATVCQLLRDLVSAHRLRHDRAGYALLDSPPPATNSTPTLSQSLLPIQPPGNGNGKHPL